MASTNRIHRAARGMPADPDASANTKDVHRLTEQAVRASLYDVDAMEYVEALRAAQERTGRPAS